MCKKVFMIATLAVLATVFVVGGPKFVSHLRYWKLQLRSAVEERIPPEQEIARLRMEVDRLALDDGKAFDQVVRQGREVKKLQARVKDLKDQLALEEGNIRGMKASLVGDDRFVTYKGERRARSEFTSDLLQAAETFQVQEAKLQSLQEQLAAKKESYDLHRKQLRERELNREKLRTELQRLETALVKEKQVQAQEKNTLDDSGYLRIQNEIGAVKERIGEMTDKSELIKEIKSHSANREAQKRHEKNAATLKYLETRFGDKSKAEDQ